MPRGWLNQFTALSLAARHKRHEWISLETAKKRRETRTTSTFLSHFICRGRSRVRRALSIAQHPDALGRLFENSSKPASGFVTFFFVSSPLCVSVLCLDRPLKSFLHQGKKLLFSTGKCSVHWTILHPTDNIHLALYHFSTVVGRAVEKRPVLGDKSR